MKTQSIKKNALLNIIYTITNIIFPLITFPYVSRILLADGMGKISFFTAISSYAILVASLGITTYGIRETANARKDRDCLSKVTLELLIINVVMSVIVIASLILLVPFIEKFRTDKILVFINCGLILCTAFGMEWLYSGLEQYAYITKRSILFKCISVVAVFVFVRSKADYNIYALVTMLASSVAYVVNFIYSRKFVSFKTVRNIELRKHIKPMLILFASIMAVNIYTSLDTVMLGFISGDKEVGLYTVAVKIKWLLLSMVNAISAVLLPRLSFYISENKKKAFNQLLKKSISVILMISLPLTAYFIILAKDCIYILGGSDYLEATLCMQIIMPILLISSFSNITGNQILIPMGKDILFMKAVVLGAITDIGLNILMMPRLASVGAAIATLVAECVQMAMQLRYSIEYIKSNIDFHNLIKIVLSTTVSSSVILITMHLLEYNAATNLYKSVLNVAGYAVLYFAIYLVSLLILKEKYCIKIFEKVANILNKYLC